MVLDMQTSNKSHQLLGASSLIVVLAVGFASFGSSAIEAGSSHPTEVTADATQAQMEFRTGNVEPGSCVWQKSTATVGSSGPQDHHTACPENTYPFSGGLYNSAGRPFGASGVAGFQSGDNHFEEMDSNLSGWFINYSPGATTTSYVVALCCSVD